MRSDRAPAAPTIRQHPQTHATENQARGHWRGTLPNEPTTFDIGRRRAKSREMLAARSECTRCRPAGVQGQTDTEDPESKCTGDGRSRAAASQRRRRANSRTCSATRATSRTARGRSGCPGRACQTSRVSDRRPTAQTHLSVLATVVDASVQVQGHAAGGGNEGSGGADRRAHVCARSVEGTR